MASHYDAVGFAAADSADFLRLLMQAHERAEGDADGVVEHAVGQTLHYHDPSGAILTIHLDGDGQIKCCQPGFGSKSRFRWRPLHVVPAADGCPFCDLVYAELLDDEDEPYYPFALTVDTIGAARSLIPYGGTAEFAFATLSEGGEVWESEDAFERVQEAEWGSLEPPSDRPDDELPVRVRGFSSRSLIPSGTFPLDEGGAMSSQVIAHGIVTSVEERVNELGGAPFKVVQLETLGGTFDTCVAPGTLEREELLAPGAVVGGMFWLVGRPLTLDERPGHVPTAERESETSGIRGRLFGRRKR